jgi:hypothetical protein
LIDISAKGQEAAALLARELLASDGEEEVLLTPQGRYVPRMLSAASAALRSAAAAPVRARNEAAVLGFASPGSLRNLEWFALPQRELAADEVEIEPVATGLNFRDVMYAMGLLSDEAVEIGFAGATIGMELSGRIARVGRDVQRFATGDAVLGFARVVRNACAYDGGGHCAQTRTSHVRRSGHGADHVLHRVLRAL